MSWPVAASRGGAVRVRREGAGHIRAKPSSANTSARRRRCDSAACPRRRAP
jgi:hypothetical protein